MDLDDISPKQEEPLKALLAEELDRLSIDELEERIRLLSGEIDRVRAMIDAKGASKSAAEAFFKS